VTRWAKVAAVDDEQDAGGAALRNVTRMPLKIFSFSHAPPVAFPEFLIPAHEVAEFST
jgi:hypothetical protein